MSELNEILIRIESDLDGIGTILSALIGLVFVFGIVNILFKD